MVATIAVVAFAPRDAHAQPRWDVELEEGVERRWLTHKPQGANEPSFAPTMDAAAHVALVPLLRAGLYAHYDTSPIAGDDSRNLFSGGLDARVFAPWLAGDVRGYLRFGVGEAATFAPGHALAFSFVPSSTGSFTEVPVAAGLLYRVDRRLSLSAEAGARLGFGFGGSAYATRGSGDDAAALFLDLGVVWGR